MLCSGDLCKFLLSALSYCVYIVRCVCAALVSLPEPSLILLEERLKLVAPVFLQSQTPCDHILLHFFAPRLILLAEFTNTNRPFVVLSTAVYNFEIESVHSS